MLKKALGRTTLFGHRAFNILLEFRVSLSRETAAASGFDLLKDSFDLVQHQTRSGKTAGGDVPDLGIQIMDPALGVGPGLTDDVIIHGLAGTGFSAHDLGTSDDK